MVTQRIKYFINSNRS